MKNNLKIIIISSVIGLIVNTMVSFAWYSTLINTWISTSILAKMNLTQMDMAQQNGAVYSFVFVSYFFLAVIIANLVLMYLKKHNTIEEKTGFVCKIFYSIYRIPVLVTLFFFFISLNLNYVVLQLYNVIHLLIDTGFLLIISILDTFITLKITKKILK